MLCDARTLAGALSWVASASALVWLAGTRGATRVNMLPLMSNDMCGAFQTRAPHVVCNSSLVWRRGHHLSRCGLSYRRLDLFLRARHHRRDNRSNKLNARVRRIRSNQTFSNGAADVFSNNRTGTTGQHRGVEYGCALPFCELSAFNMARSRLECWAGQAGRADWTSPDNGHGQQRFWQRTDMVAGRCCCKTRRRQFSMGQALRQL